MSRSYLQSINNSRWGRELLLGVFAALLSGLSLLMSFSWTFSPFWLTNAVLLGVLVRWPMLNTTTAWMAMSAGLTVPDLIFGRDAVLVGILLAANVCGIYAGLRLLLRQTEDVRRLNTPQAVLIVALVCSAASLASAVVGAWINPLFFERSLVAGFSAWFFSGLCNYLAILPMVLTAPLGARKKTLRRTDKSVRTQLLSSGPIVLLSLSLVAQTLLRGPGILTFVLPALLWQAVQTLSPFRTTVLVFASSGITLASISAGLLNFGDVGISAPITHSAQFAVALVALAPLTLASHMSVRNAEMVALRNSAERDFLTGAMNRQAFLRRGEEVLAERSIRGWPGAVMMIDIDNFKHINDTQGHFYGDEFLSELGSVLAANVRPKDTFGRLGGDEFAVLLSDVTPGEAIKVVERVRVAAAQFATRRTDGGGTVSIGLYLIPLDQPVGLREALIMADRGLYEAKRLGRNRVGQITGGADS